MSTASSSAATNNSSTHHYGKVLADSNNIAGSFACGTGVSSPALSVGNSTPTTSAHHGLHSTFIGGSSYTLGSYDNCSIVFGPGPASANSSPDLHAQHHSDHNGTTTTTTVSRYQDAATGMGLANSKRLSPTCDDAAELYAKKMAAATGMVTATTAGATRTASSPAAEKAKSSDLSGGLVCVPNVPIYSCLPTYHTNSTSSKNNSNPSSVSCIASTTTRPPIGGENCHASSPSYPSSASAPNYCPCSLTYRGTQAYAEYLCPTTLPSPCYAPPTNSMIPANLYRRFTFRGQMQLSNPFTNYPLPMSMREDVTVLSGGRIVKKEATPAASLSSPAGSSPRTIRITASTAAEPAAGASISSPLLSIPATSAAACSKTTYLRATSTKKADTDERYTSPALLCPTADNSLKMYKEQSVVQPTQHTGQWSSIPHQYTNNVLCSTTLHVTRKTLEDMTKQ